MLNYVWERLLWSLINKEEEVHNPNNHYHVNACETVGQMDKAQFGKYKDETEKVQTVNQTWFQT